MFDIDVHHPSEMFLNYSLDQFSVVKHFFLTLFVKLCGLLREVFLNPVIVKQHQWLCFLKDFLLNVCTLG